MDPEFDPDDPELARFGNEYLHRIAVINLKKYNGKKSSDRNEIMEYANREKKFIQQQIELCDPTVIVCCSTAYALDQLMNFGIA